MLFILGTSLIIYSLTIGYIAFSLRAKALEEGKELANTAVRERASEVQARLQEDIAVARTMASIIKNYVYFAESQRKSLQADLLSDVLRDYPKYEATWLSWELSAIDDSWTESYGRERSSYFVRNGEVQETIELVDLDGDKEGGVYLTYKNNPAEGVTEPYFYRNYDDNSRQVLGTSVCMPIIEDGTFIGLIGSDLSLEEYEDMTDFKTFDNSYSFLLAANGYIVAHENEGYINHYVDTLSFTKNLDILEIRQTIDESGFASFTTYDEELGEDIHLAFALVPIGRSGQFWATGTVVPISEITNSFRTTIQITVVVGLIGLLFLSALIYSIASGITRSLEKSSELLKNLASGQLDGAEKVLITGENEVNDIAKSVNVLLEELNKKALFAQQIGEGDLEASFEVSGDKDTLGHSLMMMRNNLSSTTEDIKSVVQKAGEEGNLSVDIGFQDKKGVWRELALSTNNLLESVRKPFMKINEIVNAMASGDLSLRYNESAQGDILTLANSLNQALDNLNDLLRQIAESAEGIEHSSIEMQGASQEMSLNTSEIASAISQMSTGAQNQVLKVDESSNLVEAILMSSTSMGDQSENINQAAQNGAKSSDKGLELIEQVAYTIKNISAFSEDTNHSFQTLSDRSKEITRVLNVISDIASQTNLLALNAAIEAAQAGDAGRGFAVVAEEIRKLAEDSRKSAKEIEQLVGDVQNDTNEAAKVLEVMTDSIKGGEEASVNASDAFKEIANSSNKTLTLSQNILSAAQVQITDIKKVVGITEGVVVIAEQTAAGTEEIASSASELSAGMNGYANKSSDLSAIAIKLKEAVGQFILKVR